jgi:hypothetical protein
MSAYADAQPAGGPAPLPHEFDRGRWSHPHFGPPLPVKLLALVAAFWLFHPLGVALLIFFLWRGARGARACAYRGQDFARRWDGGSWGGRGRPASRNAAFEERRRETLKALDEEAEAFDAFERKRREAEDREAFERFKAERTAPKGAPDSN